MSLNQNDSLTAYPLEQEVLLCSGIKATIDSISEERVNDFETKTIINLQVLDKVNEAHAKYERILTALPILAIILNSIYKLVWFTAWDLF